METLGIGRPSTYAQTIQKLKTGTPARVLSSSIDYSKFEEQKGDEGIQSFSFTTKKQPNGCFFSLQLYLL